MKLLCTCISLIIVFFTRNIRGTNVALGRPATQSSTWFEYYTAGRAVDGNSGMRFRVDTCSYTSCYDHKPNWVVDLEKMHTINSVTIYNPDIAFGRLHDIKIEVFKMDPYTPGATGQLCNTIGSVPVTSGTSIIVRCPSPPRGQYVKLEKTVWTPTIYNHYCDALVLCEVQVEGTLINNPGPNPGPINCSLGFERFQDSCYHFHLKQHLDSWYDARVACQSMGADLAIIESEEENNFIEKRISNLTGDKTLLFFIGLHKLNDLRTWLWIDLNAVQGVPSGQPNAAKPFSDWNVDTDSEDEYSNCAAFDRSNVEDHYQWTEHDCDTYESYICEISPTFPQNCGRCTP